MKMKETVEASDLGFFFDPGSIAVVGASDAPGKLSAIVMDGLVTTGFRGEIYPVNPSHKTVAGLECYPSLGAIGRDVDLAVFMVPARAVPGALREGAGNLRGAIVISGGFAEAGEEGRKLERELKAVARDAGVRVIGPNCMGVYDAATGLDTFFIPPERMKRPQAGTLAIVSQSGSFAVTAMDELASEGVGVARVVSYGNMADVNECDMLEFLAGDEATRAVALYIESVDDGSRFVEAAARCAAVKPVLAIKAGRAGAGAAAAGSHTGALAGRYELYRAAFKKAGVIEAGGYEEFIDGCKALGSLEKTSPAEGKRVLVLTDGGGVGISIADACLSAGLEVPPLDAGLAEALGSSLPSYFSVSNPMDLTGSVTDRTFVDTFDKTMASGAFDIAIVAALWGPPGLTDSLPSLLAERAALHKRPVIVCSPGGEYTRRKAALFHKAGFAVYPSPESAVRAAAVLAHKERGAKEAAQGAALENVTHNREIERLVKEALSVGRTTLAEPEAKEILKLVSIPVARFRVVKDVAGAIEAAEEIGFPVALKVVSPDILHKSDVGGVALGITDAETLEGRWAEIIYSLAEGHPTAMIEGFIVEEMLPAGVEVIAGAVKDAQFGTAVVFGIGGTAVELIKDVSFSLGPVTRDRALEMMAGVRGYPLLAGFRGSARMDTNAVADVLVALSAVVECTDGLAELEINPLIVYPDGVVAADARGILARNNRRRA